ncbi:MAG TPA: amino acid adenylation domain-containing protein [Pyrinomonadaceae bacterium]|nr:amino acid adenylation domain-containing protein [Pyrinomonadaceae bacterium]
MQELDVQPDAIEGVIEGYQLSPQQKHVWRAQREWLTGPHREPAEPARDEVFREQPYQVRCTVSIEGALRGDLLRAAVRQVVARHEILRTSFDCLEGMRIPVQVIRDVPFDEPAGGGPQGWSLRAGLFEAELTRPGERHYELKLSLPAMCSDRAGLHNVLREICDAYEAACGEQPGPGEGDEPMQYVELSEWFNELLEHEDTASARAYWRQLAASLPAAWATPEPRQRFTPRKHYLPVDGAVAARLRTLAADAGVGFPVLLQTCWLALLHRLTQQSDLVVGVFYDGRKFDGLTELPGYLGRYLPVTSRLEEGGGFMELLERADADATAHHKWQEYFSWEQFEQAGGGPQAAANTFTYSFEYVPERDSYEAAGACFRVEREEAYLEPCGVALVCVAHGRGGVAAELHYDESVYGAAEIERLGERFQTLLASVAARPSAPVGELEVVGPKEREQLLFAWNRTATEYPPAACVHELFEAQAAATPSAVALFCEDGPVTYGELDARANRLARYLRRLGVGPEVRVGVLMERSLEMIVGLFGILKAGGAYVPIDPAYPQERKAYMQEDAGLGLLLTQAALLESVPAAAGLRVLALDTLAETLAAESGEKIDGGASAANLAYVIYTSGSTGRPKGVMVAHQSVHNFLHWMQQTYQLCAEDRVMLKSPLNFDPSVWELFWPLMTGASVVVARPGGHIETPYLVDLIQRQQVTTIHFVPSMAQVFLSTPGVEACTSLRRMVCGGEALPPSIVSRFFASLPGELHNSYGPTETTIAPTDWKCEPGAEANIIPIGRPIANSQIYLLDAALKPVPQGAAGELFVGGASLARGYLDRPALAAEKFIPDPFSAEAGARMYRTGDLARQRPDGVIEFLGRIDHQVKIRGNRVELGEIEAVIGGHEGVLEALVMMRADGPGESQLVGYVVGRAGSNVTPGELRNYLREKLPEYMVPAAVVMLDEMPLAANGKVDRRALPAPDQQRAQLEAQFQAASTPVEEVLVGIWAELLGVDSVGVNDNFFDLGGHSLLVTQVASRVREIFEVEIPLRLYFDEQTVAGLARRVEQARGEGLGLQSPPLTPVARDQSLALSFAQQRLWFLDRLQPGTATYNLPAAVRLRGRLDAEALERSLGEVVRRHESLRTVFASVDGQPVQVITSFDGFRLPVHDLTAVDATERERELRRLAEEEGRRPFDLVAGPLLRALLLRAGADDHVLVLTTHHIVSDGWSSGVLLKEMCALYEAYAQGRPSPLPELPVQYADFATWQRNWLSGETLAQQLAYWKEHLLGAPPLELPTDRPRPPVHTTQGTRLSFTLPPELSEQLRRLSRREGVTVFVTLLAAFQSVLAYLSGQEDVSVGTPIANRNRKETENLIGFFVNTLVLRTSLSGDPTFRELLRRVREVALGAHAHQDLPFETLVEEMRPQRTLNQVPLFQVMFSLVPQAERGAAAELDGLTLSPLGLDSRTSKFDLTLFMEDTPHGFTGSAEYRTDLFEAETIKRWLRYFETLLETCAANPDLRLSDLTLLGEAERRQLLVEWNGAREDYGRPSLLHRLFEEQAELTPDAMALAFEGTRLSYRELNERANRLAHDLRARGVGPDVLVGVLMERSLEMVVGLLGILKAGGAYVPFDPSYPEERLAFMFADARARVLLTQERFAGRLPAHAAEVVCLDSDWESIAGGRADNPAVEVSDSNLAYVIYTSGSTGRPKGAMNTHRAICNRLLWMQAAYRLTAADRVVQKTPYSFDVSVWEFFWPLLSGAGLVIAKPGGHQDAGYLVELIAEQGVTVAHFVPSMLQFFVEEPALDRCDSLRLVVCSGEELSHDLQERFFARLDCQLENLYGPTEAAVDVTSWTCLRDAESKVVPIGRPIDNVQTYILNAALQPVPVGVLGELYIGGEALARGYINRSDLTAERFIPDALGGVPGARLYRTGDVARHLPDGSIQYVGRADNQVKIRGFRIELGEIEAVLRALPEVQEAVVLAREDEPGDKRLVAYVSAHPGQALDTARLRAHLRDKLPAYMVPAAFMELAAFPLTASGKINRRALPAPQKVRSDAEADFAPPQTDVERTIADIWREALGIDRVGLHDNFFDLGGHSLLMIRVHNRLSATFARELSILNLFEYPTVDALAKFLTRTQTEDASFGQSKSRAQARRESAVRKENARQRRQARRELREVKR